MDEVTRFRQLFALACPALRRYAQHRGLTGADADDLVAATLEIAWRRLDIVPDDPLPWLYGVARNLMYAHRRGEARRTAMLARLAATRRLAQAESGDLDPGLLRSALAALSHDDQEVLRLVAWYGLSPAQLAVALGCSTAAARTRLHRARNRLARKLGFDPRVPRPEPPAELAGLSSPRARAARRDPLEVSGG